MPKLKIGSEEITYNISGNDVTVLAPYRPYGTHDQSTAVITGTFDRPGHITNVLAAGQPLHKALSGLAKPDKVEFTDQPMTDQHWEQIKAGWEAQSASMIAAAGPKIWAMEHPGAEVSKEKPDLGKTRSLNLNDKTARESLKGDGDEEFGREQKLDKERKAAEAKKHKGEEARKEEAPAGTDAKTLTDRKDGHRRDARTAITHETPHVINAPEGAQTYNVPGAQVWTPPVGDTRYADGRLLPGQQGYPPEAYKEKLFVAKGEGYPPSADAISVHEPVQQGASYGRRAHHKNHSELSREAHETGHGKNRETPAQEHGDRHRHKPGAHPAPKP